MSKILTIFGGVGLLVLWVIVAMSIELPPLDTSQGWSAVPNGFLIGFMIIPKIVGQFVLIGASALL